MQINLVCSYETYAYRHVHLVRTEQYQGIQKVQYDFRLLKEDTEQLVLDLRSYKVFKTARYL